MKKNITKNRFIKFFSALIIVGISICFTANRNSLIKTASADAGFQCMLMSNLSNEIGGMECSVLLDIYNSTNGDSWTNRTGWDNFDPTCADLHGITCNGGTVTEIALNNNNLIGSIPVDIGYLSRVTSFDISNNQVFGDIPVSLSSLYLIDNGGGLGIDNNCLIIPTEPETLLDYIDLKTGSSWRAAQNMCSAECSDGVWNGDHRIENAADISELMGCTSVDGNLTISNSDLTDLSGLGFIESVSGRFEVLGNPSLINLSGLSSLTQIGGMYINVNPVLEDFTGLESLTEIVNSSSALMITNNQELTSFNGLENLSSIGMTPFIQIDSNPNLGNITAWNNIQSFSTSIVMFNTNEVLR